MSEELRRSPKAKCASCNRLVTVAGGRLVPHGTIDDGKCAGSGRKIAKERMVR